MYKSTSSDASRVLYFEADQPTNTTIYDKNNNLLYTIKTKRIIKSANKPIKLVTEFRTHNGELIADLEWNDFFTDTLTLKGSRPQSVDKWLRRSILPFKQ